MISVALKRKDILIFDDHPLVRMGMAYLINQVPDLYVRDETSDLFTAMELMRHAPFDLLLMDATPQEGHGLRLIKEFKRIAPSIPILAVSSYDHPEYIERAIRHGASGYVMKQRADVLLIPAIRAVLRGDVFLGDELSEFNGAFVRSMPAKQRSRDRNPYESLSGRELQVFELIAQGRTTRNIAEQMAVSIKTVESYRERIKGKLGLENAAALMRSAVMWFGKRKAVKRTAV